MYLGGPSGSSPLRFVPAKFSNTTLRHQIWLSYIRNKLKAARLSQEQCPHAHLTAGARDIAGFQDCIVTRTHSPDSPHFHTLLVSETCPILLIRRSKSTRCILFLNSALLPRLEHQCLMLSKRVHQWTRQTRSITEDIVRTSLWRNADQRDRPVSHQLWAC
ncbi:hypothetical protein PILCRDRAFT_559916 [Piloderma croceum F 1598]|uniref:Uncharacterized protein n=1 Tax=Piloderma croceum (strain F 1598) TaxID=765440 RepID=A0A0C3FIF5_PILCF|nr:hypothetical protein PILCRDRAFT_559916 [Piloderma croceum F 1598]